MNLRNKVSLIGRIGVAPSIIELQDGKRMAKIVLATNERYKNKEGAIEESTQWHNIVVFGKKVDVVERYFSKGKEIALEGRLVNRSWETEKGEKKYSTEVLVNNFLMLGKHQKAS